MGWVGGYLDMGVREGCSDKVTFDEWSELREQMSHEDTRGRECLSSRCKGPEVRMLLVCLRSIEGPVTMDAVRDEAVLEAAVGGEGRDHVIQGHRGHGGHVMMSVFNKYLLSSFCEPDNVQGVTDTSGNKMDKISAFMGLKF